MASMGCSDCILREGDVWGRLGATLVWAIIGWWVYMRAAEQRRWPRCCLKGLVLLQINLPVKAPDFNSLVNTKISWHMQHFQMSNHTVLTLWNWKRKANLKAGRVKAGSLSSSVLPCVAQPETDLHSGGFTGEGICRRRWICAQCSH